MADTGAGGFFQPLASPTSLVDTTQSIGISSALAANSTSTFQVLGVGGVPSSGVSAVSVSIETVSPSVSSWLEMWPDGTTQPSPGSVINMAAGQTVESTATVAVGADGKIAVYNHTGTTGLRVTVNGFYTSGSSTAPGGYVPVTQTRVIDTRNTGNFKLMGTSSSPQNDPLADPTLWVDVAGVNGYPQTASSAYVNLTIPGSSSAGSLEVATDGGTYEPVLNFQASSNATTIGAIVPVVNGQITLATTSSTDIDVIVDVDGFYAAGATQGGGFTPLQTRLLDTRNTTAVPALGSVDVAVGGTNGIPTTFGAAALTLTSISGTGSGFLIPWPSGQTMPSTSVGNFLPSSITTSSATVQPGANGKISIYNHSSTPIQLVVDLQGWYATDQALPIPDPTATSPDPAVTDPGFKPGGDVSVSPAPGVPSPSASSTPTGGPVTVSGKFTNRAGTGLGGLTVTLSASDAITETSNEASLPEVGTATTAADGTWTFTLPSPLPSNLQAIADANDGVLNLAATTTGITSSGLTMTATDNVAAGVSSTSTSSLDLRAASITPDTVALHVADLTDHSNLQADSVATSQADTIYPSADVSRQSAAVPQWQSSTGADLSGYNPDMVNGTDYSTVAPMDNPCFTYYTTIANSIAYSTVGEAHAFYDSTASFAYNDKAATQFGIAESVSGSGWSMSGSASVNNSFGHTTGFPSKGPYFAHQWKVPINYAKIRGRVSCIHGGTSYFYLIKATGYKIPPGGWAGEYGPDVQRFDGATPYYNSPSSYRAKVWPGTQFQLTSGRTVTYSWSAAVFGVGISAQTSYDANHTQGITAGNGRWEHDIWGMKAPLYGNPGGFYSF